MTKMSEEDYNPYCEICGTCGYLGCCGIRNFIEEHIKGKTNCKNEDIVINELIDLCDYKDEVFKENDRLKEKINKVIKYIDEFSYYYADDDGTPMFVIEELKEETFVKDILEILGDKE